MGMKFSMNAALYALVFIAALLFCNEARAAFITTFDSRATFDAAFPGAQIENWDSFAAGTTFANGSTVNGITYNSSTEMAVVTSAFLDSTPPNSLGRTTTGFFAGSLDTMTFGFPSPILAFGIDINTFDQADGGYQLRTNLGDVALSGYDPFPGQNTGQFAGFLSDTPISSVTVSSLNNISYTLDTLRRDSAVPEPSPAILLGFALAGLAGWCWRQHRRSQV